MRSMHRLVRSSLVIVVTTLAVACDPPPPPPPPVQPVVRATLKPGQTIEVVGLRRWSLAMIQDSLGKYAPGSDLSSRACIQDLRQKLHFADANVMTYVTIVEGMTDKDTAETTQHVILWVREPGDSTMVRPRRSVIDTTQRVTAWQPVAQLFRTAPRAFSRWADLYMKDGVDSATLAVTRVMDSQINEEGYRTALQVLRESPSNADRAIAAVLLSRFAARDEAWHALFLSAIDENQWLSAEVALNALTAMSRTSARPVNWKPVEREIAAVLNGTALPALVPLVSVWSRTGLDASYADAVLRDGGEMLTSMLELSRTELSRPARELLVNLRGKNLGDSVAVWRDWIESLR
jgi:hypothetical protein